jgi:N-methylhydantoinase B
MEVGAAEGHEFDFSAMFDRVDHPAKGRQGGLDGAPTTISNSNGSAMKGKGKQFLVHGERVVLAFPGGAGYGDPKERDYTIIARDLVRGYITEAAAMRDYGLSAQQITEIVNAYTG